MNKQKKSDIALAAVIIFSLLLAAVYVIIMNKLVYLAGNMLYVELGAIWVTAAMISIEVTVVITVLIIRYLIPYLIRRQQALGALGGNGFEKLAGDPVARVVYRGVYSVLNKNYSKAEKYLEEALSRTGSAANQLFCYEWLLKIYESDADKYEDKILWCYRKSAEAAPDNPRLQCRLGAAYFEEGKLDSAMYCFEQALRYNPLDGYAIYMTAKIQLIRGEDEKALAALKGLVEINENHPLVFAELAIYYAMHDEIEQCSECFHKAVLCGYRDSETLERRIDAVKRFRMGRSYDGDYLPQDYYRRVEPPSDQTGKDC